MLSGYVYINFLLVCLASYAAALLFRMNDDKPQEFKKRLPSELAGNTFRLDPMTWHEVCTMELNMHQRTVVDGHFLL